MRSSLVPRVALLLAAGALVLAAAAAARSGAGNSRPPVEASAGGEEVVLLHGLGRSDRSMRPLERLLGDAGYRVHNLDYPSTEADPEALVAFLHAELGRCCNEAGRLHFVTHSLGGVLTRAYLATHPLPNLGRVVMLAPPNQGSEYVDIAGDWALFRNILGPTAIQLGTGPESLPNRLPEPEYEVGVVAGSGGINPLGDAVIPGRNDGTVGVERTRLAGMRDFIEVEASHTFIMRSTEVGRQVLAFLSQGRFARIAP